jgi:hypothetical protein
MNPNEQFSQPAEPSFNPHRRHTYYSQQENHHLAALSTDLEISRSCFSERGMGASQFSLAIQ